MNAKRGFAPLMLLIVVVIVIAGGIYFYSQQSENVDVKNNTQPTTQSGNVQSYSDTKNGVEFKYPQDWSYQVSGNLGIRLSDCSNEFLNNHSEPGDTETNKCHIVLIDIDGILAKQYLNDDILKSEYRGVKGELTELNVNDIEATKIFYPADLSSSSDNRHDTTLIILKGKNNRIAYLSNSATLDNGTQAQQAKEAEVMLNIAKSFKFTNTPSTSVSKTVDADGRPLPVINTITPNRGPAGTVIEVKGKHLAGFESDLFVWLENSKGIKGILHSENRTGDTLIRAKLPTRLCQKDTSYSGLPCEAWLDLVPGVYKVYAQPWGSKSNVVEFTVTAN
jgi:hypothetical protein